MMAPCGSRAPLQFIDLDLKCSWSHSVAVPLQKRGGKAAPLLTWEFPWIGGEDLNA